MGVTADVSAELAGSGCQATSGTGAIVSVVSDDVEGVLLPMLDATVNKEFEGILCSQRWEQNVRDQFRAAASECDVNILKEAVAALEKKFGDVHLTLGIGEDKETIDMLAADWMSGNVMATLGSRI